MSVSDTKCFFNFSPYLGESVIPLPIAIDLLRYYAGFRNTKSANLLKDLEEYSARPFELCTPIPVDKVRATPPSLDEFTNGVIRNLSEALASCKDNNKRSEVVSIIQSLIALL